MPNINLYYIENISETDIPYFPTIEAMNSFMNAHLLTNATGEENYYVPYYRNVIKMSKDTFNYDTHSCNYLSLYINGRTYYYFIDSIDYVNEDCYAINIHMDTIMSFYWQIGVSACMIERKFINRWCDNATPAINRNYIRENYSNGNYRVVSNDIIDGIEDNKWVVIGLLNKERVTEGTGDETTGIRYYNWWSQPLKQIYVKDELGVVTPINYKQSLTSGYMLWGFASSYTEASFVRTPRDNIYVLQDYTYTSPVDGTTTSIAGLNRRFNNPINYLVEEDSLRDIFIIPFIPFSKDVTIAPSGVTGTYNVRVSGDYMCAYGQNIDPAGSGYDYASVDKRSLCYGFPTGAGIPNAIWTTPLFQWGGYSKQTPARPIRSVVYNADISFSFTKNTQTGKVFSTDYCPQLIDSNYIQITFGTIYANTTYPIEYLSSNTLFGKYFADCFTGKRYYYITPGHTNYNDDYHTIVCDDNILTIDMLNNAWEEYAANNKSRWATIGVQAGTNAIKDCLSVAGIVSGIGALNDAANIEKYIYDRQITNRKKSMSNDILRARIAHTEVNRQRDENIATNRAISSGIGILDSATSVVNQLQTEYNVKHTPNSMTRGGDDSSVVASYAWAIRSVVRECENIAQVAEIYHRIGYLVNEYYPDNAKLTDLLSYCNTRYYFNIIKLGECAVHINNRIENEDITLDIKYRLQQGIRYWNISVTDFELCNFKYDNVELDYLP